MSASTWIARAKGRMGPRKSEHAATLGEWIGIDLSGDDEPRRMHRLLPLLLIALIAALGVSSLRIDLIRVRYAMATALDDERSLMTEQRRLIVRRRQLRDPVELAIKARALGFRPPTRIISIPEPMIPGSALAHAVADLPPVATPPPTTLAGTDWQ